MATNRELRAALMSKLGLTPQALSRQVQKKIALLPMTTAEAAYVIAHDNGIKIHKYLAPAEVDRVRALQAQLRGSTPAAAPAIRRIRRPNGAGREIRFANSFRVKSNMLTSAKLAEAKEMSALYPILYVLENSMREVVRRVMRKQFGDDWWDTQLTSGKLKTLHQTAAGRLKNEQSRQRWHQRRGEHPIDYIQLDDLGDIILGKQESFFGAVLGTDADWFRHFMKELEPSRNVLCHMNPLSDTNARDLMTKLERWETLVAAAGSAIPSA